MKAFGPEEADPRHHWHQHRLNNNWIFSATYHGVSRIPRSVSYGIGRLGTWLAYRCFGESTRAVIDNLRAVFPASDETELRALARETYHCYARDAIDFIRSLSMSQERLAEMVKDVHSEGFAGLLAEGRGILLLTGHIGNWELGAVLLRRLYGLPLTVVAMDELDPGVNQWRIRFRRSLGVETIPVRQSPETALLLRRLLAEGRVVAMLADRHIGKDRVEVEFFGRPTLFLKTPALMGYLTEAPLLPIFLLRQADGRFEGITGPPIRVEREGDRDENVRRAAQAFASILEEQVRRHPQLWYQFYPYWSHGPDLASGLR